MSLINRNGGIILNNFKLGIIIDGMNLPFKESIEKCASFGVDGIQVYAVNGEMAPENLTTADIKEKRTILNNFGIDVSALCGDLGGYGFTRKDENISKIEKSKRIVDLALEMGTNIVTTHIGVVPEDSKCDKYMIMQEACNELAEYAHSNSAYFAIETGPEPADRLKVFLDSLSSKGVAVNMDPANLVMVNGDDPVNAVRTLKDYIVHTHAKDGRRLQAIDPQIVYDSFAEGGIEGLRLEEYFVELSLGQGDVNFDTYLAALRDIGYNGYLTIEREFGDDPVADIWKAVEFLRGNKNYIC